MKSRILLSTLLGLAIVATFGFGLGPGQKMTSANATPTPLCTTVQVPVAGGSQVATYFISKTFNGNCVVNFGAYSVANPCVVVNGIATSGHCVPKAIGYKVTASANQTGVIPAEEWFHFNGITLNVGQFLDMVDTTPFFTQKGHVAMVLPCDSAGTPQVTLVQGVIDAGVATLETPDMEYLQQLSSTGSAIGVYDGTCVYHFDIGTTTTNPDGATDFALINKSGQPAHFTDRNTSTFSIAEGYLNAKS
jgi:hypothetical protein